MRDFASARAWYERLFGRPPDMLPKEGEAVWRLCDGASVYVVEDEGRAGSGIVTVAVDDLDGIDGRRDGPKVIVTDPDGNEIAFFVTPS
ncbi:MAG: VOC family protein [Gaiellaceae bacterium]